MLLRIRQLVVYLLLLPATVSALHAQNFWEYPRPDKLYEIRDQLKQGDKPALWQLSSFLDSTRIVLAWLAHHSYKAKECEVARGIIRDYCLFTSEELVLDSTLTSDRYKRFLDSNASRIVFSPLAKRFLITPLEQRPVDFRLKNLTPFRKQELAAKYKTDISSSKWFKREKLDQLIKQKNSRCLLVLASVIYHDEWNDRQAQDVLQHLTGTEIGFIEKGKLSTPQQPMYLYYHKLDLLVFFARFYKDYRWNDSLSLFVHPGHSIQSIRGEEKQLFQQLLSTKDDEEARAIFIRLSEMDPVKLNEVADEYKHSFFMPSSSISGRSISFLKQLSRLTEFCRQNSVNYKEPAKISNDLMYLKEWISFKERRKKENEIIEYLTLDNITALEYWAICYREDIGLFDNSIFRILDIFYSRQFDKVLASPLQLKIYLKKASLFQRPGIAGPRSDYLLKFRNLQREGLAALSRVETTDTTILAQISRAKAICMLGRVTLDTLFVKAPTKTTAVDLRQRIDNWKRMEDDWVKTDSMNNLLDEMRFDQIGELLSHLDSLSASKLLWQNSYFPHAFNLFLYDFETQQGIQAFLTDYKKLDELAFYQNMLTEAGLPIINPMGEMDYDLVYELLKYDLARSFPDGGGFYENEVYSLIRVLELSHKTTLGFQVRPYDYQSECKLFNQALQWRNFIEGQGLLKHPHNDPESFNQDCGFH